MSQATNITDQLPLAWPSYIAGEPVQSDETLEVRYPWDGSLTGTLPKITPEQLEQAIAEMKQAEDAERTAMMTIDWHDFVVVETISFEDEEALPAPEDLQATELTVLQADYNALRESVRMSTTELGAPRVF